MLFQTAVLITTTLLATTANAQIRVYDPQTGGDVEAPTQQGLQKDIITPQKEQPKAPARRIQPQQAPKNVYERAMAPQNAENLKNKTIREEQDPEFQEPEGLDVFEVFQEQQSLGTAAFFIDKSYFTERQIAKIRQASQIKNLAVEVYVEELDTVEYMALISSVPEGAEGVDFTVDSNNYRAKKYGVEYHTILYLDPDGSTRRYDLVQDFDKFLRHVERLRREKGLKS